VQRAIVLTLVVGLLPATPAAAQGTRATIYRPYRANGTSILQTSTHSGRCWTGSSTAMRSDAWRCMTGNEIADPCFSANPNASSVVCPQGPWTSAGLRIRLTKPLPRKFANRGGPSLRNQPWALELGDGSRCLLDSGASSVIESERLNYFCGAASPEGLWGLPNRHSEPWTILIAPFTATHLSERAAIVRAWM
jgi:hypothetical protein